MKIVSRELGRGVNIVDLAAGDAVELLGAIRLFAERLGVVDAERDVLAAVGRDLAETA